jgi:hypothetical protein
MVVRRRRSAVALPLVVGGGLALAPLPALADVIDGDWCAAGRHLAIKGPEIVTPAGNRLTGNYSRHFFSYVGPPAEPEAGKMVAMTLINENTVHLRLGADPAAAAQAAPQTWLRCAPPVSRRDGNLPTDG